MCIGKDYLMIFLLCLLQYLHLILVIAKASQALKQTYWQMERNIDCTDASLERLQWILPSFVNQTSKAHAVLDSICVNWNKFFFHFPLIG